MENENLVEKSVICFCIFPVMTVTMIVCYCIVSMYLCHYFGITIIYRTRVKELMSVETRSWSV